MTLFRRNHEKSRNRNPTSSGLLVKRRSIRQFDLFCIDLDIDRFDSGDDCWVKIWRCGSQVLAVNNSWPLCFCRSVTFCTRSNSRLFNFHYLSCVDADRTSLWRVSLERCDGAGCIRLVYFWFFNHLHSGLGKKTSKGRQTGQTGGQTGATH